MTFSYNYIDNVLTITTDRSNEFDGSELADDLYDCSNGLVEPLEVRYIFNSNKAIVTATIHKDYDFAQLLQFLATAKKCSCAPANPNQSFID